MFKKSEIEQKSIRTVTETIGGIEQLAHTAEVGIEKQINPIRKSLLKRFPTTFLLLVSAGFILVSFAIEEMLRQYPFFTEHPFFVLMLGLFFLILTGAAYKKNNL